VPTVVAGAAWLAWIGRTGWLARAGIAPGWLPDLSYSLGAVILAHVFFNAPWVALQVAQALDDVSLDAMAAARTLGAGRLARFRFVLWPEARWAFAASVTHVFALCSMSFALVLLLGGGPPVETLETALYARVRGGSLDLAGAAACALWEAVITLGPWVVVCWLQNRQQTASRTLGFGSVSARPVRGSRLSSPAATFAAFLWVIPYLAIFSPAVLRAWGSPELRAEWLSPLTLSLEIAAGTAIGAAGVAALGVFGLARSRSPWLAALLTSASGVSVLVLGLGGWFAYQRWIDPFEGSLTAMIVLQVAVFSPIAFRMLWPLLQNVQGRLLEAAATLGASPARAFWHVEWPRWRGPLLSALALVGAASLGEVAAVSLFYSEKLIPLPLLVSRKMAQYQFDEAQAISALLFVVAVGAVFVTFQLNGRATQGSGSRGSR
jgi:thiamine transport system permease protein